MCMFDSKSLVPYTLLTMAMLYFTSCQKTQSPDSPIPVVTADNPQNSTLDAYVVGGNNFTCYHLEPLESSWTWGNFFNRIDKQTCAYFGLVDLTKIDENRIYVQPTTKKGWTPDWSIRVGFYVNGVLYTMDVDIDENNDSHKKAREVVIGIVRDMYSQIPKD